MNLFYKTIECGYKSASKFSGRLSDVAASHPGADERRGVRDGDSHEEADGVRPPRAEDPEEADFPRRKK